MTKPNPAQPGKTPEQVPPKTTNPKAEAKKSETDATGNKKPISKVSPKTKGDLHAGSNDSGDRPWLETELVDDGYDSV